jgi:hypothetical protein
MRPGITLHGFRSAFATWAQDETEFPSETVMPDDPNDDSSLWSAWALVALIIALVAVVLANLP